MAELPCGHGGCSLVLLVVSACQLLSPPQASSVLRCQARLLACCLEPDKEGRASLRMSAELEWEEPLGATGCRTRCFLYRRMHSRSQQCKEGGKKDDGEVKVLVLDVSTGSPFLAADSWKPREEEDGSVPRGLCTLLPSS